MSFIHSADILEKKLLEYVFDMRKIKKERMLFQANEFLLKNVKWAERTNRVHPNIFPKSSDKKGTKWLHSNDEKVAEVMRNNPLRKGHATYSAPNPKQTTIN